MLALQLLLDKLNNGNIPINKTTWEQLQQGGPGQAGDNVTNINVMSGGAGGGKQVSRILSVMYS